MIWQDLGHPLRAWELLFSTNFTSVMGWMVWLYTAYFILLMAELWFALRTGLVQSARQPGLKGAVCRVLSFGQKNDSAESHVHDLRVLRVLGSIGVPLAIAFHDSVGAIFGTVSARPYWNSGLTPIMFLVGAFVSGGALLAFITAVWGPNRGSEEHRSIMQLLGTVVLGLLALDVLLEWAEYSVGLWYPVSTDAASVRLILFGPYGWAFWGLHIVGGIVIPGLLLIFKRRSVTAIGLAGLLIAATFLTVRLNIVLPALAVPEIQGIESAFTGPGLGLSYAPSVMEWLVLLWDISLAALVFLVGLKVLPIIATPDNVPDVAESEQPKLEVA
jgi:protein NrfD